MRELLLDTHALLWFIAGDDKLSANARQAIESLDATVYVSIATLWEIAIKISVGKLRLSEPFEDLIPGELENNQFRELPIEVADLSQYQQLPLHHRDPFDRLLIAQAKRRGLVLVSRDSAFRQYGIETYW
ncbi:MAG: type II toxin-antitoxin system VapC family toxin [Bacteroidota bacterium]